MSAAWALRFKVPRCSRLLKLLDVVEFEVLLVNSILLVQYPNLGLLNYVGIIIPKEVRGYALYYQVIECCQGVDVSGALSHTTT